MGINDEYSRDAHTYELAYNSEDDDLSDTEVDPEDWQDLNSAELLDGWMIIREYMEMHYLQLDCGFSSFVGLVQTPEEFYLAREMPDGHIRNIWRRLSGLPVISGRVCEQCFNGWMVANSQGWNLNQSI